MSLTKREDVEALLCNATAHDGFHVKEVILGNEHSLHFVFYVNGVASVLPWDTKLSYLEFWSRTGLDDADFGEKVRVRLLAEALCRYTNTGGDKNIMQGVLRDFKIFTENFGKFEIPEFHHIDTSINTNAVYEHVFASDGSPWAIRWVEDEFLDVVSLSDMLKELTEEDRVDQFDEKENSDAISKGETGQGVLPQLPDSTGASAEEASSESSE